MAGAAFGDARGRSPEREPTGKRLVVKGEGKTPDFVARGRVLMNPPFATSSLEVGF
jgi:hypothetical protein